MVESDLDLASAIHVAKEGFKVYSHHE